MTLEITLLAAHPSPIEVVKMETETTEMKAMSTCSSMGSSEDQVPSPRSQHPG